ncbi:DUF2306 domain-containing protein [Lewinella sp. IMCC34183]|uniref:DUF2306 domain-containing protein n=1 Tax=Lewinella sp. IMCC34183 TaxID=2248762 RepID=UPI000E230416|nr:DUF2306 domain-containing protein [Lewinella sp. IMCC34183]
MTVVTLIHTTFSLTALLTGGYVFLNAKGTRSHVRVGKIYVLSMLILIITSMFIYDFFGGFGVFHIMALVSLVTMSMGMVYALFLRHRRKWLAHHYMWMCFSYVGLVMAGGSHLFGVFPDWPSWLRMVLFWVLPYGLGSYLIYTNRKRILSEVRDRFGLDVVVE